ncbi:Phospholipid scramblase 1, partial [Orchesella cincta]
FPNLLARLWNTRADCAPQCSPRFGISYSIGSALIIKQKWNFWQRFLGVRQRISYKVKDSQGQRIVYRKGRYGLPALFCPSWAVSRHSGARVEPAVPTICDYVKRRWCSALVKFKEMVCVFFEEAFTDADNFGISFPMDLDVPMKAVMLWAHAFCIDFMFFENVSESRANDALGML